MNIISILNRKTKAIMDAYGEPIDVICNNTQSEPVDLTVDEMNILCDPEQLRAFKIYQSIPGDYKEAANIDECITFICNEDCLYRTLEYYVLKNRALNVVRNYVKFAGDMYADK